MFARLTPVCTQAVASEMRAGSTSRRMETVIGTLDMVGPSEMKRACGGSECMRALFRVCFEPLGDVAERPGPDGEDPRRPDSAGVSGALLTVARKVLTTRSGLSSSAHLQLYVSKVTGW
ncbi:hypothetical protein GCM10027421_22200 [Microbacterium shaanxiense]